MAFKQTLELPLQTAASLLPTLSFLLPLLEFQAASDKTQNLPQGVPISVSSFADWAFRKPVIDTNASHSHKPHFSVAQPHCGFPRKGPKLHLGKVLLGMWEEGLAKLFKGCPSLGPERGMHTSWALPWSNSCLGVKHTHTHPQKPRPESSTSFNARV